VQEWADGIRKCLKCSRLGKTVVGLKKTGDNEAWFWSVTKRAVLMALRCESAIKHIDWTEPSLATLKDGHLTLKKYFNSSNQAWINAYSQQAMNVESNLTEYSTRDKYQKLAFQPSVDAVFPYGEFNKSYWIHCPSNLALTSLTMQFAKHVFVPAVLAHVSD